MRERAAAVGASCEIVSHPGRGVLVRVSAGPQRRELAGGAPGSFGPR
jgi:nitrate/nitrite-specific signal transduction histidine kinase